ncbi:unnamed protein product, partial [Linum tenue]
KLGRIGLKEENTRSGGQIPDRVFTTFGRPRSREGPGHSSKIPGRGLWRLTGDSSLERNGALQRYPVETQNTRPGISTGYRDQAADLRKEKA